MSRKNSLPQTKSPEKPDTSITVAQLGIIAAVITAIITVIGMTISGYFNYLGARTQVELPIQVTQTVEARMTETVFANLATLTQLASTAEVTTALPSSSDTPLPSLTPEPTNTFLSTPTLTPEPTLTFTPTIEPRVFRGIDNNCIDGKYWHPMPIYQSDKITLGTNNCWNLSSWGIAVNNKTINFSVQDKDFNERVTRGIYAYIYGKTTTIQFKVKVDALTSASDMDGALFIGLGNDDDYTKPGLFIKFVVPALQKKVFFETGPDYMDYWTPRNDYIFGETLSIKIVIIDSYVTVSVGDSQVRAVNLDATSREVLWIGYTTHSSNNYVIADIFDFSIYEK